MPQLEDPLLTQPPEEWLLRDRKASAAATRSSEINDADSEEMAEQSREQSGSVPQQDVNVSASSSKSVQDMPMFQTAGTNKAIYISKESLSRANDLFDADAAASQQAALESAKDAHEKIADRCKITKHANATPLDPFIDDKSADATNPMKQSLSMFQTAGEKTTVQVSKESISKANENKLLSGMDASYIESTAKPQHESNCSDNLASRSAASANQPFPMFQTAGKKNAIHISADSLSKANKLFSGVENASSHHVRPLDGSSSDLLGQPLVSNSKPGTDSLPVFQTAGKKQTISVSAESLSKAHEMFSNVDAEQHTGHNSSDLGASTLNTALSKPMAPTFQTAGKKQTIQVSNEGLTKANALFSEMDVKTVSAEVKGDKCSVLADMNSKQSTTPPSFQTAGKGIEVQISADSMTKANDLFSGIEEEIVCSSIEHVASQKAGVSNLNQNASSVKTAQRIEGSIAKTASTQLRHCEPQSKRSDGGSSRLVGDSSSSSSIYTSKINPYAKASTTPRPAVFNPYTNRKPFAHTPRKRTITQINQSSVNTVAQAAKVAKYIPVNNPYAKSKPAASVVKAPTLSINNARQSLVKNPYATKTHSPMNATNAPGASNPVQPKQASIDSSTHVTHSDNSASSAPRSAPTSRFFSMADRLPSRNVSYKPAEILSVGELYRYLYCQHSNECKNTTEQDNMSSSEKDSEPVYRELTSVRITGVLLSSTYSDSGEGYAQLYGKGQWLLIGDPLDNTRFVKKQQPAHQKTPNVAQVRQTPAASKGATSLSVSKENVLVGAATPKASSSTEKDSSNAVATASRSTGLLNDKKRKFVYNKGPGRNSLSSSKSLLNAKKFQTPKRVDSASSGMNTTTVKRGQLFSAVKKGGLSATKAALNKNKNPVSIVQNHPSPIVPVWNGSTRDGNGLDGSVIGDLVMIMGEIVVELCDRCRNCKKDDPVSGGKDIEMTSAPKPPPSIRVQDIRDAARLITAVASQEEGPSANCCRQCVRFLRARFVKNANGTDMNLQKEALRVRREYLKRRQIDMAALVSSDSCLSIGLGPLL